MRGSVLLSASDVSTPHRLRRESILFLQRQDAAGVFFIEQGLAKLTRTSNDGSKLIFSVAGPNQLIGEECLGPDFEGYFAESVCLTELVGYHLPVPHMKRIMAVPEMTGALIGYTAQRNREFIEQIELLACHDVEHRVLHGLAKLATLVEPSEEDGAWYPIPITQAELASFVGATRETTSTTLGVLRTRKLVQLGRRLITTVDPEKLINAANDRMAAAKTTS